MALLDELNEIGRGATAWAASISSKIASSASNRAARTKRPAARCSSPRTANSKRCASTARRRTTSRLLSLRYAEMVYYGMWFTPLREALDAFFTSSQKRVTGSVGLAAL